MRGADSGTERDGAAGARRGPFATSAIGSASATRWLDRQAATLALSHVQVDRGSIGARVAAIHNGLVRLGLPLPLFAVHDFAALLATPPATRRIGPRLPLLSQLTLPADANALLPRYEALLEEVAASELGERGGSLRLRDEVVAVLLGRVLGGLFERLDDPAKSVGATALPLDPSAYEDGTPAEMARRLGGFDVSAPLGFLRLLVERRLEVLTSVDLVDVEALRLFGLLGAGGTAGATMDLVDLHAALGSAEASDVVDFSLELLPSVLETRRAAGVQRYAVDGYASIERKGSADSMLLTEFAYDDELFERKVLDDEIYYYGRERQEEEERRLQYILIDSSPSMRGVREVFARGLALALGKKLALGGDEAWLRFFDSRLYEVRRFAQPESVVPHVLGFRSERGRNYGRVFRELSVELLRLRREERRRVVVHFITHGQCHLPLELVRGMAENASLHGIFVLPSSELALGYTEALDRCDVVDAASLSTRHARRTRALDILSSTGAG